MFRSFSNTSSIWISQARQCGTSKQIPTWLTKSTGLFVCHAKYPLWVFCGSAAHDHPPHARTQGPRAPIIHSFVCYRSRENRLWQRQPLAPLPGTPHSSQLIGQRRSYDEAYCPKGRDMCPSVPHTVKTNTQVNSNIIIHKRV